MRTPAAGSGVNGIELGVVLFFFVLVTLGDRNNSTRTRESRSRAATCCG